MNTFYRIFPFVLTNQNIAKLLIASFVFSILLSVPFQRTAAAGTITGRVFQDYNGNGVYNTTTTITNEGFGSIGVAIDRGVAGVTVSAYDSAGVLRGTTTTIDGISAADAGTYTLSATGTGPYRIEFTNLPTGFAPSARSTDSSAGGTATNSGSTVQFVADGTTANVNLAVNYPAEYTQNNPEVVASLYKAGDQGTGASNFPVLVSFPYSAGSSDTAVNANLSLYDAPTINPLSLTAEDIGTTYGLAYAKNSRLIYAGSYFKRHAGFGPGGVNQIYVVNRTGSGNISSSFTVPGTATNLHDTTNYPRDNGNTGWDAVGKSSLGGITLSEDESALFTYNLANRTLYKLNPGNGAQIASQATLPNLPVATGNCAANDRRPFALTVYRNVLYAGFVCSAESSTTVDTFTDANSNGQYDGGDYYIETNGTAGRQATESYLDLNGNGSYEGGEAFVDNDGNGVYNIGDVRSLRAYIFTVDQSTLAYSSSPVFTLPLGYRRGVNQRSLGGFAQWRPWSATYRTINSNTLRPIYPQPMLTDIAFDNGNIVLGLRDRISDQVGNGTLSNPNDSNNLNFYQPRPGGDAVRACGSINFWTAESNGRCGGTGAGTQNSGEGIGGGEFYYGDSFTLAANLVSPAVTINGKGSNHDETFSGGVEQLPGAPDVMIINFDPVPNVTSETHDGGIRWLSNTTGNFTKGFRLYDGASGTGDDFGKSGGTGGNLTILADPAPIELGNRVWRDSNNNGVQDAGEIGISGVTVRLYNTSNILIATAVTDSNGEYYFVSGAAVDADTTNNIGIVNGQITPNTNYQIRFDLAANYTGAGPLTGLLMTTRDQTSQAGFDEGSDSDASLVVNPTGSPSGTFPLIAVITGENGSNNHNLDVGFASSTTYSIGNRVWFDTNNDGQINAGEVGISGVSVSLFLDANGDGTPDNPASPAATQSTDANGYYRFDNLAANNYVVRINPSNFANAAVLSGYANTAGNNNTDIDSTSVAGQNGENGINPTGAANIVQTAGILSGSIALGAPGEPVSETDVPNGQGSADPAANMTVDFGFYRLNLSGTVWNDTGAGANNNNGNLDSGELGIPAIVVRLYTNAGVEIPVGPDGILGTADDAVGGMNTNGSGNYNFQGLAPGTYRVVVTSNGGTSSTPTDTNPDNNDDNDDNGFPDNTGNFTGKVISGLIVLSAGGEPIVNNAAGSTSNPTVDFGFVLAPTAIQLESFDAFANTDGSVTLKWSTGGEADNLGFNIYREFGGKREMLNDSPIAGSALRSSANLQASGDSYSWFDAKAVPGAVYYLEDIDLAGSTTLHGAISAKMHFSSFNPNLKSTSLSDLANLSAAPKQIDAAEVASAKSTAGNRAVQDKIAAQTGVKLAVKKDGWYRVSAEQLQAAGFEVDSRQAFWQMFVNAEEVPLKINPDNSIEFFGRGLDTLATDKQTYYLTVGNQNGLRVGEIKGGRITETDGANSFRNVTVRRDRGLYASAILNGDAENWFGAVVNSSGQTAQDLTVYNPDANGGEARLTLKLQGLTMNEHLVSVRFNDFDLGTVNYSNRENSAFEFNVPANLIQSGANRVSLQAIGAGSDVSLVDSITLNYARLYQAENDRLHFTVPAGQSVRVTGFISDEIGIYEIRNGKVFNRLSSETQKDGGTRNFSLAAVNYEREILAVGKLQSDQVVSAEADASSDWRNPSNEADFVIITPNAFRDSAGQLAELRQSQGLKTEVVAIEDLSDEFTFGAHSPEAVKEFLRTATSKWKIKPQFALLFGDSSYDSRNYLGGIERNLVPTKLIDTENLETASDAWLADFDNDGIEDIALGRLPVVNQTEAAAMITKLRRYERRSAREEKTNLFVSDVNFENYSNTLRGLLPENVGASFVNRTGATDSEMRQELLQKLDLGATVVTYSGHGSNTLLTGGNIFRNPDALNLNNQKLSFYLMMTCLNGFTHNASTDSLAESLMKSGNGAIAVWASSGTTHADGQSQLSQSATNLLFNSPQPLRIGVIVRTAKQSTSDQDIRRTWQLIGDPTVFIR